MRTKRLALFLLAIAVLGSAIYGTVRFFAPATDHAIRLVPEHAAAYASAFLKPSTDQRRALRALLERFPSAGSPEEAEATVDRLLDSALDDLGLVYSDDVKPWIGHEVGAFMLPLEAEMEADGAVLIATDDEDEALDAVRQSRFHVGAPPYRVRTHDGVEYGLSGASSASVALDGFLVLGTEPAVKAAIEVAEGDRSLADIPRFSDAIDRLPEDRLGLFYVDSDRLLSEVSTGAGLWPRSISALLDFSSGSTAGAVFARPDAVVIDAVGSTASRSGEVASTGGRSMLDSVGEQAWGIVDSPGFGRSLGDLLQRLVAGSVPGGFGDRFLEQAFRHETGLDLQNDVLDWMGDAVFFVQGTEPETIGGGAVMETTDPARSARVVDRLHGLFLARSDARVTAFRLPPGSESARRPMTGFTIRDSSISQPLNVVATEDRVVIALGEAATSEALTRDGGLGRTSAFAEARSALGEDFRLSAVVFVAPLLELVTSAQDLGGFQLPAEALPDLRALTHLVTGSRIQGNVLTRRIVVEVR